MGNLAIKTENLGKRYRLGATVDLTKTFREVLLDYPKYLLNLTKSKAKRIITKKNKYIDQETPKGTFWALKNINLEIDHGEVVGIIGKNGAGKSTLLKILSRITTPTTGKAILYGRVGSLLEVGTGFHPELTGRENIYLNGSILGMTKTEIDKKFDEIVSFAEVEDFLDTPIKRYSSGMQVRLAFAVAAHLEPEILVVDEVLAVGDAEFQKKCLGKMGDISKEGRTVLFVSHNMGAIEQLCQRVIILDKGIIISDTNDVQNGIKEYLHNSTKEKIKSEWINTGNEFDNPYFKPLRFAITDKDGNTLKMPVRNDEDMYVWIEGEVEKVSPNLMVGFTLYNLKNNRILTSYSTDIEQQKWIYTKKGKNIFFTTLPKSILNNGNYFLEMSIRLKGVGQWLIRHRNNSPIILLIIEGSIYKSAYYTYRKECILAPILKWYKYCKEEQDNV